HDSAERYPQPKCHPETRTEMLDDLWEWSLKTDSDSSILWLHGPAGAGKSAIAQSFCHRLEAENRLGASFFFKRGHPSRGNGNKLFPTIAYQLARCSELKQTISHIVADDPSIIDRALSMQLRRMIIEPFQQNLNSGIRTFVIVIDGLDECESQIFSKRYYAQSAPPSTVDPSLFAFSLPIGPSLTFGTSLAAR
ncbi:hypothetical protein B0H14DRAFT_2371982, partial [Mycena olivaceomarginata]